MVPYGGELQTSVAASTAWYDTVRIRNSEFRILGILGIPGFSEFRIQNSEFGGVTFKVSRVAAA